MLQDLILTNVMAKGFAVINKQQALFVILNCDSPSYPFYFISFNKLKKKDKLMLRNST
ncbi:hypothetical protein [Parafilimonas terrae]|uniref:hypothetical protein n=1 Tax=Parafilimonas terrae TaxID=1465490 RepID=UPI0015A55EC3|nr:hypothetical protein [Parafilimonas terrae]